MKFVVCLLLIMATARGAETKPVRVLCWNLHHGVGMDGKLDLPRIAKVIREAKPDLVALQEVDNQCSRTGKIDQAAELSRLTEMTGVFGKAMDFGGGAYGQAILSRHPIRSSKVHALPSSSEPRIAFEAIISIDGSELRFVSVHLDLDAAKRLEQTFTLVKLLAEPTAPTILCGDFNDVPGSAPLAVFPSDWKPVPKSPPSLTEPADKPTEEIDHFYVRGFTASEPVVVLPEAVASDHRPISGLFTLK